MSDTDRFYVATVSGFRIGGRERISTASTRQDPGLSAHVLDRAYLHATCASYHSESPALHVRGKRLKAEGALRLAQAKADELNAWDRSLDAGS